MLNMCFDQNYSCLFGSSWMCQHDWQARSNGAPLWTKKSCARCTRIDLMSQQVCLSHTNTIWSQNVFTNKILLVLHFKRFQWFVCLFVFLRGDLGAWLNVDWNRCVCQTLTFSCTCPAEDRHVGDSLRWGFRRRRQGNGRLVSYVWSSWLHSLLKNVTLQHIAVLISRRRNFDGQR